MKVNLLTGPKKLILSLVVLFGLGCGVNEAQRDFRNEALSPPSEITETTATGIPIEGEKADKSDWRIAPRYSGIVKLQPPSPNPVQINGTIFINLRATGIQAVNGLQVYVYNAMIGTLDGPFHIRTQPLKTALTTITISPTEILRTVNSTTNLYRIVIFDGSRNIITYGDIKVVQ